LPQVCVCVCVCVYGFVIRELSRQAAIGVQEFVVRNDCPCGSTIGPAIAALTGIRTVDVGISSLSMHSIRETIGVADIESRSVN
jgi:aspartyl aminopeptidase